MASGKLKDTWFIWALVIVSAVFAVIYLAGRESRVPVESSRTVPAENPPPVAPAVRDTLPAAVVPAVNAEKAVSIKPDHSSSDMKAISDKKPASSVVVPPQTVASASKYAIQVYSFKEKLRAETALNKLKDKNHKAYIMVSDLGARGIWYRVRVGPFASEQEAQKALEGITQEFKSGIIVSE